MKIILLKDVPKVGKRGDIKNTSDGFARNFLFPQSFAVPASDSAVKKIEKENELKKIEKEKTHEKFHALKEELVGRGVVIHKKTDEAGNLYAGVSRKEIIEALKELKFPVPGNLNEDMIQLSEHIKTLGEHTAKIVFSPNEEISLKVEVRKLD